MLDLIERKAEGQEITIEPAPEEPAKVPDLMAALEASLAATKKKPSTKAPAGKSRASAKTSAAAKKDGRATKRPATRKKREKAKA